MKLSISNIAWTNEFDEEMYSFLKEYHFQGLEIAPTRIFPEDPYDQLEKAKQWSNDCNQKYGFKISSLQSIWYGRQENLFHSTGERNALLNYTKKAIDFAEAVGAKNLVFGCPRNRNIPSNMNVTEIREKIIPFFQELGTYAEEHHTVIGMEANPAIYNTNFINTTIEAIALIKEVNTNGFKMNFDLGTVITNNEDINVLRGNVSLINHVHISEPHLHCIQHRDIHKQLFQILKDENYQGYVSIEMGKQDDIDHIIEPMKYVKEVFE